LPRPGALTVAVEKPACRRCNDHRWLNKYPPVGHPDFGKLFPCPDCNAAAATQGSRQLPGLTDLERQRRLDDIEIEGRPGTGLTVQACREFAAHPSGILTFCGGPGNGKTLALQATTNELVLLEVEAVYIKGFDLIHHIQEAFDDKGQVKSGSAYDRFKHFAHVKVLAIDDLDKVHDTSWAISHLTALIDERYRMGQEPGYGTLIAMNKEPELLPAWVTSRLRDGRNRVVHNQDSDIRPALRG